ncbi:MAG: hypothetical protein HY270_15670 [Deltaproteobacteria bacterium]|nr:hypothetical protein [Deltaproteobacteria bacterium]
MRYGKRFDSGGAVAIGNSHEELQSNEHPDLDEHAKPIPNFNTFVYAIYVPDTDADDHFRPFLDAQQLASTILDPYVKHLAHFNPNEHASSANTDPNEFSSAYKFCDTDALVLTD